MIGLTRKGEVNYSLSPVQQSLSGLPFDLWPLQQDGGRFQIIQDYFGNLNYFGLFY